LNNHNDKLLKNVNDNYLLRLTVKPTTEEIKKSSNKNNENKIDYKDILLNVNNMLDDAFLFDDLYNLLKLSNALPSAEFKYKVLDKILQKAHTSQSYFNYYKISKLLYDDYILYHTTDNLKFIYSIICEAYKLFLIKIAKNQYYDYDGLARFRINEFKVKLEHILKIKNG